MTPVTVLVLLALSGACGCAHSPGSQGADDPEDGAPLPGGCEDRDPGDASIEEAADHAVALLREQSGDESIALAAIVSAQTQVVAGVKYRLKLSVETAEGPKTVTVVLYRDLEERHSLTSVEGL